jgi:hypothetical protein
MGSSSVRRDILSQFRQEKLTLGITGRSRRGRRGRRSGKDSPARHDLDTLQVPRTSNGGSDQENIYNKYENHEVDDEEEFFDAEDNYLDDMD